MLNVLQFRLNVVRPVLEAIGSHSMAAENLVLGTALQESNTHYLRQLAEGPACGLFQMEPATHDDIWDNYLGYRNELSGQVSSFLVPGRERVEQLIWNLAYATAMCRVHYRRVPEPLPDATDIQGLAAYWKQHYNTSQGKGTVQEFAEKFENAIVKSGSV